MSSWTTQELSLPAAVDGVVSKTFLNRDPQYVIVELQGLSGDPGAITIQDSADGILFKDVASGGTYTLGTTSAIFRFDASVETTAKPLRNICRIKITNAVTFDKVFVTWSP